jgi:DNA-binding transcriptional LysR family regulator
VELKELRTFCTAARLHSISKAAKALDISQPSATKHVHKLEQMLGLELMYRGKRPIQLTPAGATLALVAKPFVEGLDNLVEATSLKESLSPVTIAAPRDFVTHSVLHVVTVFQERYPDNQVRIQAGTKAEIFEMVTDGRADLGLIPDPNTPIEFDFKPLFQFDRVLLTPLNHPLLNTNITQLAQIAEYPLIMMRQRTYSRDLVERQLRKEGRPYKVILELESMDVIKEYVAAGLGVSVGPGAALEPKDNERLGVMSLGHLLPIEQAGMVTHSERKLSTPARYFAEVMEDVLSGNQPFLHNSQSRVEINGKV